jgi:hypothetical protein
VQGSNREMRTKNHHAAASMGVGAALPFLH